MTWWSVVTTAASSVDGRRPAHRGPEPGQQLVHAERLGDVVVGAGVEGGHLVGLGVAHRQHDDRHLGPAPQARDHLDAVDAGQAEVEDHHVGVVLGGEAERLLAGRRQVDLVARGPGGWCARARRICGSSSTTSTRVMPRPSGSTMVSPPPGVSSASSSPPMRLDEPAGDGQAEADARRASGRPGAGRARTAARPSRPATPGPVSMTRRSTRSPTAPASIRTGGVPGACGGGRWRQVGHRPARAGRGRRGSAAGTRAPRPRPGRWAPTGSTSAAATTSSQPTAAGVISSDAGLEAAHVEQVADQGVEPVGLLVDGVRGTRAVASGGQSMSSWSRLLTDALIDASGVRRSWDTARRSAVRSASDSAATTAAAASARRRRCSSADDELGGEGVQHPLVVGRERRAVRARAGRPSPSVDAASTAADAVAGRSATAAAVDSLRARRRSRGRAPRRRPDRGRRWSAAGRASTAAGRRRRPGRRPRGPGPRPRPRPGRLAWSRRAAWVTRSEITTAHDEEADEGERRSRPRRS